MEDLNVHTRREINDMWVCMMVLVFLLGATIGIMLEYAILHTIDGLKLFPKEESTFVPFKV